jgi:exonuclease VII small subunit
MASRAKVVRVELPSDFLGQLSDLRSAEIVLGHFFYPVVRLLPETAIATVLRDPVERTISVWEFLQWEPRHPDHDLLASRGISSIDEFARDVRLAGHVRNNQTQLLGMEYDLEAIVAALEAGEIDLEEARRMTAEAQRAPADAAMLARAKQRLGQMLVVGVTEQLPAFVRRLEHAVGLPPGPPPEQRNVVPADTIPPREEAYDESTRRGLADLNALDVELYAFARELCGAQRDGAAAGD